MFEKNYMHDIIKKSTRPFSQNCEIHDTFVRSSVLYSGTNLKKFFPTLQRECMQCTVMVSTKLFT